MHLFKYISALTVLGAFVYLSSCQSSASQQDEDNKSESVVTVSAGESLINSLCVSCHSPAQGEEGRVAPPLHAVQKHYLDKYPLREDFEAAVAAFLSVPTQEKVIMTHAYEKFGLMPNLGIQEEQIRSIAAALYSYESPNKMTAHEPNLETMTDLEKGQHFALHTKSVLGANLMKAVKEKGAAGAVDFCSTRALPITDSMSVHHHVQIKRVAKRNRNPLNAASSQELSYIEAAEKSIAAGESVDGQVHSIGDKMVAYYPILTNDMCLKCHGDSKSINVETANAIAEKYPDDLAVGFKSGDLRGIWVVEWDK